MPHTRGKTGTATVTPTACEWRWAASSWVLPARCAAATKSSAQVPAAFAPNVERARAVAEARYFTQRGNARHYWTRAHAELQCVPLASSATHYLDEQTRRTATEGNSTGRGTAFRRAAGAGLRQGTIRGTFCFGLGD